MGSSKVTKAKFWIERDSVAFGEDTQWYWERGSPSYGVVVPDRGSVWGKADAVNSRIWHAAQSDVSNTTLDNLGAKRRIRWDVQGM